MADVAGLDWGVTYPINFTPTGDLTSTAIHQHIQEIAKMYGHLNYLRGNVDGGATIGIEKFVPTPADLPEGANVGDVYMTNGEFYNLYVWDGNNWVQLNTSSLPIATTTTPGISIRGTLEGYLSDTPSENKHVSEYMLKQATAALAGSGVPSGTVVMWHGVRSNVPAGWAICDGTQGTPNLLGRFVRCVDSLDGTPGATGGNNNFTLTNDHLPQHDHAIKLTGLDIRHKHNSLVPRHQHQLQNIVTGNTSGGHVHHVEFNTSGASIDMNHAHDLWYAGASCAAIASVSSYHVHPVAGATVGSGNHTHYPRNHAYMVLTDTGNLFAGAATGSGRIASTANFYQGTEELTDSGTHEHEFSANTLSGYGAHSHNLNGNTGYVNLGHLHAAIGDTGDQNAGHSHQINSWTSFDSAGGVTIVTNSQDVPILPDKNFNSESQGYSVPFDNRPAYIDMLYIMKL